MSARTPRCCHHKERDLAYVRIGGRQIYLGRYNSPGSRERYEQLVDQWRLGQPIDAVMIALGELSLRFDKWAREYYRHPDGTPTGTDRNIRDAVRYVNRLYASTRVNQGKTFAAERERVLCGAGA